MVWPIVTAAILGMFCGGWVPLLHFTLIALAGVIGCALSMWISGYGPVWSHPELLLLMLALQAGYVTGLVGQIAFTKKSPESRQAEPNAIPRTTRT